METSLEDMIEYLNSTIDFLIGPSPNSKEDTVPKYIEKFISKLKFVHDLSHSDTFMDDPLPEFILQSVDSGINPEIPSYNVAKDFSHQASLTTTKLDSFEYFSTMFDSENKK